LFAAGKGAFVDLLITKLVFTLRLGADVSDPAAFFAVKKCFRQAFQKTVCRSDEQCGQCLHAVNCSYDSTFAQHLATDATAVKRHQKPSLPFVFQIPLLEQTAAEGEEVQLGLVLIGSAMRFVTEYCTTVLRLFDSGGLYGLPTGEVLKVESVGCSGFRNSVFDDNGEFVMTSLTTMTADDTDALNTLSPYQIGLRIITPMRVMKDRLPLHEFSFSPFVRALLRRVSSLAYYYCGSGLDLDYKHLARLADTIEVEDDRFQWAEWRNDTVDGITGSGILTGRLSDFHLVLLLGEFFNCGKGASFGFGRYELVR
jgi:hypothetical protein